MEKEKAVISPVLAMDQTLVIFAQLAIANYMEIVEAHRRWVRFFL